MRGNHCGVRQGAVRGRDYEPVKGQWYENVEEDESFRVLSVDEDAELVEIEYLDGDIEEMDLDTWHEMDLEKIEEPEGWAGQAKTRMRTRTRKKTRTRTRTTTGTMMTRTRTTSMRKMTRTVIGPRHSRGRPSL